MESECVKYQAMHNCLISTSNTKLVVGKQICMLVSFTSKMYQRGKDNSMSCQHTCQYGCHLNE